MTTRVVKIDPLNPNRDALAEAASVLRGGGLVAYPTETVYGLAANARLPEAILRLSHAKQRPPDKPYPVQIARADTLTELAEGLTPDIWALAEHFWPGPLTLVVQRKFGAVCPEVGGGNTLGVRVPAHPVALGLLQECGLPLACPSANVSGCAPPHTAEAALAGLNGRVDLLLDGGPTGGTVASTVLDVTVGPAKVVRLGPITHAELAKYLPVQE